MASITPEQLEHLQAHQELFDEHQAEKNADIEAYFAEQEDKDGPGSLYRNLCSDFEIEPVLTTTPRGFRVFDEFRDKYGSMIRVQQSSLATDDCIWIFASDNPSIAEPSPHLNVEMAQRLIAALQVFVSRYE